MDNWFFEAECYHCNKAKRDVLLMIHDTESRFVCGECLVEYYEPHDAGN